MQTRGQFKGIKKMDGSREEDNEKCDSNFHNRTMRSEDGLRHPEGKDGKEKEDEKVMVPIDCAGNRENRIRGSKPQGAKCK